MEELRVGRKGKSTDSRIIFSAGQGTGSSCSINHPTELISQQWLEKQFCESEFYRHQQQKKSGCSSFNSKTGRRKMVHIYTTETKNLKTCIPQIFLLSTYNKLLHLSLCKTKFQITWYGGKGYQVRKPDCDH